MYPSLHLHVSHRQSHCLVPAGGKLVVMYGGQIHDGGGSQQREVNPLHLDSLAWQAPVGVKTSDLINAHSAVTVARTKMMCYRSAFLGCHSNWHPLLS